MKTIDTTISCDVCRDLIPLVLDQVASEDSTNLVKKHIAECDSCKEYYGTFTTLETEDIHPNDQQIIKRIRKAFYVSMLLIIFIGGLFGIALTNTQDILYNIFIMPIIGFLSYIVYRKRWILPCLCITLLTYVWIFILSWKDTGSKFSADLFLYPVFFTMILCILMILGVLIAALITYAFKKEDMAKNY